MTILRQCVSTQPKNSTLDREVAICLAKGTVLRVPPRPSTNTSSSDHLVFHPGNGSPIICFASDERPMEKVHGGGLMTV